MEVVVSTKIGQSPGDWPVFKLDRKVDNLGYFNFHKKIYRLSDFAQVTYGQLNHIGAFLVSPSDSRFIYLGEDRSIDSIDISLMKQSEYVRIQNSSWTTPTSAVISENGVQYWATYTKRNSIS